MTAPKLPEGLEPVAYLVTGLHSGEPSLCFEDERGDYGDEDHTPVFDGLVRLSDAQAALQAQAADTARLDWIARQADEFSCSMIMDAPGDGEYIVHGMDGYGQGKTPREAIDNAMRFNAAASTGRGEGA